VGLAAGGPVTIQFTPHLVPVNRGILTTLYFTPTRAIGGAEAAAQFGDTVAACYSSLSEERFVRLLTRQGPARYQERGPVQLHRHRWRVDRARGGW